jgi:putative membrane protein insertion efficiency factor
VFVIAIAIDLRRDPSSQLTTRVAVGGIHLYQATLSPLYGRMGVTCRFEPTCSYYGEAVIKRYGVVRGGWMATKRILRCGPWTPAGTKDPPPVTYAHHGEHEGHGEAFRLSSR